MHFQVFPEDKTVFLNEKRPAELAGRQTVDLGMSDAPGPGGIPQRAAGLGQGLVAGQAKVGQPFGVERFQHLALAPDPVDMGKRGEKRLAAAQRGTGTRDVAGNIGHRVCPFSET
jgi:hypothetical protein